MLVLTRHYGQQITIVTPSGTITISHFGNVGRRTKIGIDAPEDMAIYRTESRPAKDESVAIPIREAA